MHHQNPSGIPRAPGVSEYQGRWSVRPGSGSWDFCNEYGQEIHSALFAAAEL